MRCAAVTRWCTSGCAPQRPFCGGGGEAALDRGEASLGGSEASVGRRQASQRRRHASARRSQASIGRRQASRRRRQASACSTAASSRSTKASSRSATASSRSATASFSRSHTSRPGSIASTRPSLRPSPPGIVSARTTRKRTKHSRRSWTVEPIAPQAQWDPGTRLTTGRERLRAVFCCSGCGNRIAPGRVRGSKQPGRRISRATIPKRPHKPERRVPLGSGLQPAAR